MPVFPVVHAVTDAEFVLDVAVAHELVNADALVEEEVIVAAIEEPSYGAELLEENLP